MAENPLDPSVPDSESLEALARDRKRARGRLAVVGLAIVVAVGGGAFALTRYQDAQAEARIAGSWGRLSRCMIGDPLRPGETPSVRLRSLQLTAMTLPEAQRAPADGQSWPTRCATDALVLSEALKDAGRAPDLAAAADKLGKQIKEGAGFMADLTAFVDPLWAEAGKEKLSAADAPQVPPPPPAASPLTADTLSAPLSKTPFSLKSVFSDPHPGEKLHLLIDDQSVEGSPFLCTVTASSAECRKLPGAIAGSSQGVRLLGTSDDDTDPLIFAGKRGAEGVYRSDTGELVHGIYSYGGYATKDGFSAVLGWNEGKEDLILVRKQGETKHVTTLKPDFRVGNYYYSAQLLWDSVVLRGVTKQDKRRLFVQHLERGDKAVGDPVDVGELPEAGLIVGGDDEPPHIAGCRTKEALAVRVKGYDNEFVTLQVGGRWSQPVLVPTTGGAMTCRKAEAVITAVDPQPSSPSSTRVVQRRCTSAGCNVDEVKVSQLLNGQGEFAPRDAKVVAADVDGKLLLVWAAGDRGGVRMRLAPADQIAKSPDVILYDDLVKDGKVGSLSTLFDIKAFSRPGYALLVMSTQAGVHAVRVTADGAFKPLAITWKK